MPTIAIELIPDQRQIHTGLLIGRPDGVTWVEVAPWLVRWSVERGDTTNIGVGGNDGVLQLLKFDLHNDGTTMPTWRDSIEQDESYVVGDESTPVGDEQDSASILIDLLFDAKHSYVRDSFSPHDRNSAWNKDENGDWEPLLWSYREVILYSAQLPIGVEPGPDDWDVVFHGYLGDNIGVREKGSIVSVTAKSLSKLLQDTLIEVDRTYGSDEGVPIETVMQQILDDNLGQDVVTLYCPVPTSAVVKPYIPKDVSVWDALQELAGKIGWFLGDRFDPVTKKFRLTLMEPPIDKNEATADFHFTWTKDILVQELDVTDRHYRNAVVVEYWDEDAGEVRTITADKPGSPRRTAKFSLGQTPLIRTAAEAVRFANAALHDLSDDTTLTRVTLPLFTKIDTYAGVVIENPLVASDKMFFGVDMVRHECDYKNGRFTTEFVGSGKVVGARYKWRKMQTRPGFYEPTTPEELGGGGIVMPVPASVNVSAIDGGLSVYVPKPPIYLARWGGTEIHVSTTEGFTPDETTLAASSQATRFTLSPLTAVTHYIRARYIDVDGKPGEWSDEVSETPSEPYAPDLTPPDPPEIGTLVSQALDLGSGRYDISVTVPFTTDNRTVRVIFERREGTSGDWREVGQAKSSPWTDRGGLKVQTTYQYRARAESAVGVASNLSNVRQTTIPVATVVPPNVTGLTANFDTPDLVVSWTPVVGAVKYRVQVWDANGMRREDETSASNYRYTYADNVEDGTPPATYLIVRVWAVNAFDNESLDYAEGEAEQPEPGTPTNLVALPTFRKHVLTWDRDNPPPEIVRYELQVSTSDDDGATWSAWATVDDYVQGIIYAHDGLDLSLMYRYRLRSVSAFGLMSDWTIPVEAGNPGKVSLSEDVVDRLIRDHIDQGLLDDVSSRVKAMPGVGSLWHWDIGLSSTRGQIPLPGGDAVVVSGEGKWGGGVKVRTSLSYAFADTNYSVSVYRDNEPTWEPYEDMTWDAFVEMLEG